jgi:hypothetical protein
MESIFGFESVVFSCASLEFRYLLAFCFGSEDEFFVNIQHE